VLGVGSAAPVAADEDAATSAQALAHVLGLGHDATCFSLEEGLFEIHGGLDVLEE
jgi:hypothetical protein